MHGYKLNNFKNNKAFIHFDGVKDSKADYGARICIDKNGNKLFELPDRDMIVDEFEDEDIAFVMEKGGLYAVMNNKGDFLTDFIYNGIYGGSEEGLFEAERNGKHGHIDINGKEIIPCMYDEGSYFSEGVVAECLNGKWGMVDYFNNTVIPFEYEDICICKNNIIGAKKNGKIGLINKNNDVIIDFKYEQIGYWMYRESTVYPAQIGRKWGLIDRYDNIIQDFIYDDVNLVFDSEYDIGEFIIILKGDKKALYSTRKREFLTDFIYDFIGGLSEGRFDVSIDNKFGFIDTLGNTIVPCIYDLGRFEVYREGVCVVHKDDKCGMIDLLGNVVVPFDYYNLGYCHEGLILATDFDGSNGYIDKKGNIVIPFGKYSSYYGFHEGYAQVYDKKLGKVYIDKTGKMLDIKINEV